MLVNKHITICKVKDFNIIWPLFKETVSQTNTFIYHSDITQERAKKLWEKDIIYAALAKKISL